MSIQKAPLNAGLIISNKKNAAIDCSFRLRLGVGL